MALGYRANLDKTNCLSLAGFATDLEREEMTFWVKNREIGKDLEEGAFWMALAPVLFQRSQGKRYA